MYCMYVEDSNLSTRLTLSSLSQPRPPTPPTCPCRTRAWRPRGLRWARPPPRRPRCPCRCPRPTWTRTRRCTRRSHRHSLATPPPRRTSTEQSGKGNFLRGGRNSAFVEFSGKTECPRKKSNEFSGGLGYAKRNNHFRTLFRKWSRFYVNLGIFFRARVCKLKTHLISYFLKKAPNRF